MMEKIRRWAYGVHRLSKQDINTLWHVRLLKAVPTKVDMNNLRIMEEVFQILHRSKSNFSFEIWKDKEIEFYFHVSKGEDERELVLQLNSVYPNLEVEQAMHSIPWFKEGDYISGGILEFKGQPFNLKTLDDFNYDPLVHILEAIDSGCMIQIMFKPPTIKVLEVFDGKSKNPLFNPKIPIYNCSIRAVAYSPDYDKARKSCERILNSLSVFNSNVAQLEPKMVSFPLFRNSYRLLRKINKRKMPSYKFPVTSKELASFVHLPINAEDHGIRYAKPSLGGLSDEANNIVTVRLE